MQLFSLCRKRTIKVLNVCEMHKDGFRSATATRWSSCAGRALRQEDAIAHVDPATMNALAFALLALLAGLAGSVQIAIMGRLGQRVGSLEALAFAPAFRSCSALASCSPRGRGPAGSRAARPAPPWLWLGALMGDIVFTITFAGPRIGTTATIAMLIAGQLVMGVVIDRYGLFGLDKIPLNTPRAVGIVLLAAGAALTLVQVTHGTRVWAALGPSTSSGARPTSPSRSSSRRCRRSSRSSTRFIAAGAIWPRSSFGAAARCACRGAALGAAT